MARRASTTSDTASQCAGWCCGTRQGEDINQRMLALSTYLGHVKVSSTYWYLTGVPELMGLLGQAFERYASPWEDGDE
jgi:hypothetical protein